MADPVKDLALCDALFSQRANFERLWDESTQYVVPYLSTVQQRPTFAGERRGVTRYDSTAPDAAEKLAGVLGSTITNPAMDWIEFQVKPAELNERAEVNEWLEQVQELFLAELAASNFYTAIDETWLAYVGYGTVAMHTTAHREEGTFLAPHYEPWPIREFVFTTNYRGVADTVYRKFELTAVQARDKFNGKPGFKSFGRQLADVLARGTPAKQNIDTFEFVHKIGPRKGARPGSLRADQMAIESIYIDVRDKHVVCETGYPEMPTAVARWRKNADDRGWGRGPGLNAMPDIRSLNEYERRMLQAQGRDVAPPWAFEHRGVIGSVRLQSNGLTYLRRGSDKPFPMVSGQRFDWQATERERKEHKVRMMFGADTIERLFGEPTPQMTAFEFGRRLNFMRQLLGSTFGRTQRELLDPMMVRTFYMLLREKRLPPPPPILQESRAPVQIEYVGPLARAQRSHEIESIQQGTEFAAFMAKSGYVEALDTIDAEKATRRVNELLGVPADIQRSAEEVADMVAARAEQQQIAQGLAGAEQGAGAIEKLARATQ